MWRFHAPLPPCPCTAVLGRTAPGCADQCLWRRRWRHERHGHPGRRAFARADDSIADPAGARDRAYACPGTHAGADAESCAIADSRAIAIAIAESFAFAESESVTEPFSFSFAEPVTLSVAVTEPIT